MSRQIVFAAIWFECTRSAGLCDVTTNLAGVAAKKRATERVSHPRVIGLHLTMTLREGIQAVHLGISLGKSSGSLAGPACVDEAARRE